MGDPKATAASGCCRNTACRARSRHGLPKETGETSVSLRDTMVVCRALTMLIDDRCVWVVVVGVEVKFEVTSRHS